ncbi:MAG: L-serine ammonia-lyase, iron-sulfur-dependent, subunit alpha [Coriobacteriia bacterium]
MAYASFHELLEAAAEHGSLGQAALVREAEETAEEPAVIRARMAETLAVMREAVATGLTGEARSRSGFVGGDAAKVVASKSGPVGGLLAETIAAALAVGEVNAAMGRIVAAPTGGAAGVLPAVLLGVAQERGADDEAIVDALLAAGAIGAIIAARATLAGAAGGCQAEVGAGSAMAAAAAVELCGGTPAQAGHAASLALQGQLGLVCDPIGGLVEVPCIYRNATGSAVALAAVEMALAGVEFPVPLDEVIDTMSWVGRSLPPSLRETALGGLAATPTGKEMAARSQPEAGEWRWCATPPSVA